jgi:hypothetical protein
LASCVGRRARQGLKRRVQQATLGHRGHKGDLLYGSAPFCAPASNTSPTGNKPDCGARSKPTTATTRSALGLPSAEHSRGSPDHHHDHRLIPHLPDPRDRPPPAHSATVAAGVPGLRRHRRCSQTVASKRSTASSNSTAASPPAYAIATTTDYKCS